MKKSTIDQGLLSLMVSVYNQSIQTYYYFPEVIICGRQRIDRQLFEQLVAENFVFVFKADSFGRYYRLSKKGEDFLFAASFRRRQKQTQTVLPWLQRSFPFTDTGVGFRNQL